MDILGHTADADDTVVTDCEVVLWTFDLVAGFNIFGTLQTASDENSLEAVTMVCKQVVLGTSSFSGETLHTGCGVVLLSQSSLVLIGYNVMVLP